MDNSPLGALPSELRHDIYTLTFSQQIPVSVSGVRGRLLRLENDNSCRAHARALTHTCKQLREETRSLYFSSNAFFVTLRALDSTSRSSFPKSQPDMVTQPLRNFLNLMRLQKAKKFEKLTVELGTLNFTEVDLINEDIFAGYIFNESLQMMIRRIFDEVKAGLSCAVTVQSAMKLGSGNYYLISIDSSDVAGSLRRSSDALLENVSREHGSRRTILYLASQALPGWQEELSQ